MKNLLNYSSLDYARKDILARFRSADAPTSALLYITHDDDGIVQYGLAGEASAIRLGARFISRAELYTITDDADYGGEMVYEADPTRNQNARYLVNTPISPDMLDGATHGQLFLDADTESVHAEGYARLYAAVTGNAPYRLIDHADRTTYVTPSDETHDAVLGQLKEESVHPSSLSRAQLETTPDGAMRWVVRLVPDYED